MSWRKIPIRSLLLKLAYPFLLWVGKLHMPYSHKKMSGEDYYSILKVLKKGHVFITLTYGELTNLVIPGNWSHGAMYVGEIDGIPSIVEAGGKGVVVRPLVDFILAKDDIRILRPLFATDEQMSKAADEAMKQLGASYDYGFEFTIQPKKLDTASSVKIKTSERAFYCVELIVWSYTAVMKVIPFKLRKTFGEPGVTPDDFVEAHKCWGEVWDKKSDGTTWE